MIRTDYCPHVSNVTLPGPTLAEACGVSAFVTFLTLLEELIRSNDKISGRCERITPIDIPDKEYDFVVVGGGGAGSAVAARLSENPRWKVLLLEAGQDEPVFGAIPMFTENTYEEVISWEYTTMNESYSCLSSNGSCSELTGKMLGGSTSHNAMLYNRGIPLDYDNWAAQGNEGWGWEDVKEYYMLAEDNGEIDRVGTDYHATGGPLSVERFPYIHPFAYSILNASVELGYGVIEDVNGEEITGFAISQTSSKSGTRVSSAKAYLRPARNRKNLHISLYSQATRIIIKNDKAVGVEYYKNGELKTVYASKEVVVSTGTIASPQLLLLSGIGPQQHLKDVGVDVVKDLPGVGENFHDHTTYYLSFTINETDTYDNNWDTVKQYLENQTGPLSGTGVIPVVGRFRRESTSPDATDFILTSYGFTQGCAPGDTGALHSTGRRAIRIYCSNIRPKSRGRISLASNDPFDLPSIWGNYLSDDNDVDIMIYSIKAALALADTEALRAHDITLTDVSIEECSDYTFLSTEYWICAIRQNPSNAWSHPAGSCKMGPASDPMAVVDPQLKVHGIKGLRVADNSIMPQVTSGNTGAPAMMIGERAADFIKKDWGFQSYY